MLAKVARFTNTKYTNNKITSIKANNQIKMSTEKRDVSQSPVLLESNKSIAEDKAPSSAGKQDGKNVPEREIAKESPSSKKPLLASDLQPHEELYHWKKPAKSAAVLGAGLTIYYFLFIEGYTFVTLLGFTLLFNILFNLTIFKYILIKFKR